MKYSCGAEEVEKNNIKIKLHTSELNQLCTPISTRFDSHLMAWNGLLATLSSVSQNKLTNLVYFFAVSDIWFVRYGGDLDEIFRERAIAAS